MNHKTLAIIFWISISAFFIIFTSYFIYSNGFDSDGNALKQNHPSNEIIFIKDDKTKLCFAAIYTDHIVYNEGIPMYSKNISGLSNVPCDQVSKHLIRNEKGNEKD